jgi:acetyltransferase-like isoleucine patch superfamily enzyme
MLRNILWRLWPWRYCRAARLALRGVLINPTAILVGCGQSYKIGRGTKVGAHTRLITDNAGQIITGEKVWISSDVEIQTDSTIQIGDGTSIQRRCSIIGTVQIGKGCIFSPNVFVSSGTHAFRFISHLPIREQEALLAKDPQRAKTFDRPVRIEDDCWIGVNVFIGPGVTIGKGSVVGANAVVTRDVPPYAIVGGVPAQIIGQRLVSDPHSVAISRSSQP